MSAVAETVAAIVDVEAIAVVEKSFDLSQTWEKNRWDCPNDFQALQEEKAHFYRTFKVSLIFISQSN